MADSDDISILASIKAKISTITVDGLKKTKDDLALNMIHKPLKRVDNFRDLLIEANEAKTRLHSLGIFSRIELEIDTVKDDPHGYALVFKVEEKGAVSGKLSTTFDQNDLTDTFKLEVPNLFGLAEKFSIESSSFLGSALTSAVSSHGLNLDFKVPLRPWTYHNPVVTSALFLQSGEKPWSGFRQTDRGVFLDLSMRSIADIQHNLRWAGIWREVKAMGPSLLIRGESGHSLKSSIGHSMSLDRRDRPFLPNMGYLLQFSQEYAGFGGGGDARFLKNEVKLSQSVPLIANLSLEATMKTGLMSSNASITDRFFLGGPMNLRGFNFNGVGPHSEGNALGATTYWVACLHLYGPLPFKRFSSRDSWLKTHCFLNAGNIANLTFNGDQFKYFNDLLSRHRLSAGLGLVFTLGNLARLELNYCIPIHVQPGDRPVRNFQFGIGIDYV